MAHPADMAVTFVHRTDAARHPVTRSKSLIAHSASVALDRSRTDKMALLGGYPVQMPWRRLFSIATIGLVFVIALSFTRPATVSAKPASNGQTAGDPTVIDLDGYRTMVARYEGKPLLVTFWATWCTPCRSEFPLIVSLSKEYASQGLQVVGVSLDEDSDMGLVRRFLDQTRPGFPNYREKNGIDTDAFYSGVNPDWKGTMPQTDFYGRDGHLARYFIGERNRDAFVQAIRLIMVSPNAENRPPERSSSGD
jgi:thiol-disulfide isomerase/thioredoxin